MNCCVECFRDIQIKAMINANGMRGDCDFCRRKDISIYPVDEQSDLSDLLSEVISMYEESDDGEPLFSLLINHWGLFNKELPSSLSLIAEFCSTIYGGDGHIYNKNVRIPRDYIEKYGVFSGHTWAEFSKFIKENNRFFNGYFKADQFVSFLSYSITKYSKGTFFIELAFITITRAALKKRKCIPLLLGNENPAGSIQKE